MPPRSAIRLLAVDLDGTLLDSQQHVSARNAAALRAAAAAGATVALATGRRYRFALPVAQALGVECWLIASNGALLRHSNGAVHGRQYLPRAQAAAVMAALAEFEAQLVVTFERQGPGELVMKALGPDEQAEAETRRRAFAGWLERNREALRFAAPLARCLTEDPVQLMYGGTPAEIAAIGAKLAGAATSGEITCHRTVYPARQLAILDVLAAGVSKGAALARLAAELGVARAAVMAVGDNYNDLEMLEFAGVAAVVGNAHAELRRAGWLVAADHDHDGVADALAQAGVAC